jgi:hypothetical protein
MSISTILLLLLFLGISLVSKAKKAVGEQSAPMGGSAVPEEDDDLMPMEEGVREQAGASPYFTYEADSNNTYRPKAGKVASAPAAKLVVAEEPQRPQFDLRQAVVSQVILNNKYIDEINQ